ncbi:dihydroorotase [Amaricoccus solimangrovi]|uniref:Dihydroorotase n=1 Tax=Amaricoccus solimangrovi TaxID=2589815 RepID=A0A501WQX7_9RHOB|nr:dihydroorotase [Amaricoccus solimangrovi]TPE50770.1 dihydroorotase [Amaricoccus solimangrovi]
MTEITLTRPDDWHLHLRDGAMLAGVLPASRDFARAIVMPNLVPPVVTAKDAAAYRARILAALPEGQAFEPLMTLYLTESTDPADVAAAAASGLVTAVKLYPAGATTNSASGVRDIGKVMPVLERMAEIGLPLCVHGEVTDPEIDIFDREAVFIERVLAPLRERLPELRVTLEHVTTKDGIDFILGAERNLAGSLTVHHLILNRNHLLVGGMRPHFYCLPIIKRERHRAALVAAATGGDPRFFLGTDSAPHAKDRKECDCCAAGVFTAPNAMPWLAQVFETEGALDRLEGFASLHGPAWYRRAPNADRITLARSEDPLPAPAALETGAGPVIVFDPGIPLHWRVRA